MKVVENIILRDTAGDSADVTAAGALKVDGSAAPQPITDNGGSVTVDAVSLPLPTGAATETTLDAIKTAVEILDNTVAGNELQVDLVGSIPAGTNTIGAVTITDTVDTADVLSLLNGNGLAVTVLDTNGDQVNTFGGTEYLEGTVDATATGALAMMEAAGDTMVPVQGTVADGLLVNLGSNNDVTVTGSVTANAGTNLNTSALCLETTLQSVKTAVETIDNAINGAEMQVDIVTIPVVTVAQATSSSLKTETYLVDTIGDPITDDATNSLRVNIVAGSSSGTEYVEDAPSVANPAGPMTFVVREDSLAAVTDTNGDNIALRGTNKGELYVKQADVVSVDDNGASITVDGTITANQGGTWNINNISGAINLPTGASSLGEQQTQTGILTTIDGDTGNISTKIDIVAGAVSGTEVQVDVITMPTVTVTGTVDTELPAAAALADDTVNPTTPSVGTFPHWYDGATWDRAKGDSTDGLLVNLGANNDISGTVTANAGTNLNTSALALETTATSIKTAVEIIDNAISGSEMQVDIVAAIPAGTNNIGDVDIASIAAGTNYIGKVRLTDGTLNSNIVDETGASAVDALAIGGGTPHDSVDSGNPVKVGFKAINALPTAVAANDRTNAVSDLWGRQLVSHIDPAQQISKSFNATTTQTGTDVWDPGASAKIAIISIIIGTYGTTAGRIILWFGDNADTTYTAGTDQLVLAASFAPSATVKPGLVYTPAFPIFCTTADRELHITTDAGISIDVTVYGYEW